MGGKSNKRELALAALLTEPTIKAAAVGVSCRTLKGWLKQPEFQAAYRAARAEVRDRTIAGLLQASHKAVERLVRNLDSESDPAANRAAELILAHAAKGVEEMDLRAELADLRRLVEELQAESGDRHDQGLAEGSRTPQAGGESVAPSPR